ncbi:MAG: MAPEG family protein [Pseudomonadota bacterium]
MDSIPQLSIIPIYLAVLGVLFVPFTMRVGMYRMKSNISLGTGDDRELERRMRAQANFVETVPLAIVLLIVMEFLGATPVWLHALGSALVIGRIAHYLGLSGLGPAAFRPLGMILTLSSFIVSSVWILLHMIA